ncbi:MAG: SMR family transporter [Myxococcota bacterium]
MRAGLMLAMAIVAEVAATSAMKAVSQGANTWLIVMGIGYLIAFVGLVEAMRSIPLGIAYAIWSGFGTVGAVAVGAVVFGERFGVPQIIGTVLVVVGAALLNLTTES